MVARGLGAPTRSFETSRRAGRGCRTNGRSVLDAEVRIGRQPDAIDRPTVVLVRVSLELAEADHATDGRRRHAEDAGGLVGATRGSVSPGSLIVVAMMAG